MAEAPHTPHRLLAVGSSRARWMRDALADAAKATAPQVIAVDPLADAAQAGGDRLCGVLSDQPEMQLTEFNLPGLIAAGKPTAALRDVFPGLAARGERRVTGITGQDISPRLGPADGPLTLLMDAAGGGEGIGVLHRGGILSRVTTASLRCAAEPYFDGGASAEGIAAEMARHGFALTRRDEDDSAWPVLHFGRRAPARGQSDQAAAAAPAPDDALARLNRRLQQTEEKLARAEENAARIATERDRLQDACDRQSAELAALREDHAILHDDRSALEALICTLTPRLQAAAEQLRALEPPTTHPPVAHATEQEPAPRPGKKKGKRK